jgi:hypothetical protein
VIRVLHIANNSAYAENPITKALRNAGFYVLEIDFLSCRFKERMKPKRFVQHVLDSATSFDPNFIFIQIQHAGVIDYQDAYYLNQIAPVISFSGDVRDDITWHEHMSKAGCLTVMNNDEDVEKLRSLGLKADYLQVSFHTDIHHPKNRGTEKKGKLVFIGNNYQDNYYPLSSERIKLCQTLKDVFGNDFHVFGQNWNNVGIEASVTKSESSSYIYSGYDIAINHSHYQRSRYSSDRLFYILGSGSFCLTQWYPRIEEEFTDGKHLVVYKDLQDLVEKCHYWLKPENENERNLIAKTGCDYVHTECTWDKRIEQLKSIIKHHFPKAMTKNDNWVEALKRVAPDKHYSQFGEESFIGHIFNNIGTKHKFFVDLGAGDGVNLSNTKYFKDTLGWQGLMVDADNQGNGSVYQSFITDDNIIDILEKHNVPEDFDFLSIDLDGNDYYVLDRVLTDYSPSLILAEFNGTIPTDVDKVMAYNSNHIWGNDDYYGASFKAFKRLGEAHGYATIFSYASTNIYLIRKVHLVEPDKDWGVTYQPMQYHAHNPNGRWIIY